MKIALCLSGQARSFKQGYEYYKRNLLDNPTGAKQLFEESTDIIENIKKILSPVRDRDPKTLKVNKLKEINVNLRSLSGTDEKKNSSVLRISILDQYDTKLEK